MLPYYQLTEIAIGPIHIQAWGLFVALGMALALFLGEREVKRRDLDVDAFLSLAIWMIVASIFGSRLLYIMLFAREFQDNYWQVFAFWSGGMVAFGGIVAAILAGAIFARKKRLPILTYLDVVAVVFPIGYAVGRIGCHLIRDHMGSITTVPWAFGVSDSISRHDTALYSILAGLVIFLIVWPMRKRLTKAGAMTALVSALYATTRFVIDFFRAQDLPASDPRWFGLTISQYISLLVVIGVAVLYVRSKFTKKSEKSVDL